MKVVLFCGGMGVRMGEVTQRIPKPMITVGTQPILWHLMKWYASWGHTDFVLCLGYRADVVKEYFLNYNEAYANDFVLAGSQIELLGRHMDDWRITFLDTGLGSTIGERLKIAQGQIGDDEYFLANYGDGLTDVPLDDMIDTLKRSGKTGIFIAVHPRLSYHIVETRADGLVKSIAPIGSGAIRINGGYFVFHRKVFDEIGEGEELVEEPFRRLMERNELLAYPYDGFWEPMDTIKDKQKLDALHETGRPPWRR